MEKKGGMTQTTKNSIFPKMSCWHLSTQKRRQWSKETMRILKTIKYCLDLNRIARSNETSPTLKNGQNEFENVQIRETKSRSEQEGLQSAANVGLCLAKLWIAAITFVPQVALNCPSDDFCNKRTLYKEANLEKCLLDNWSGQQCHFLVTKVTTEKGTTSELMTEINIYFCHSETFVLPFLRWLQVCDQPEHFCQLQKWP